VNCALVTIVNEIDILDETSHNHGDTTAHSSDLRILSGIQYPLR